MKTRLGRLRHLKLQFAVPGWQSKLSNCTWKDFREVSLKGFTTCRYGWSVRENGTICNFWDSVDSSPSDTLKNPSTACSSLRVVK